MRTYEIRYKSALFGTWALYGVYGSLDAAKQDLTAFRRRCLDTNSAESLVAFKTATIE